MVERELVGVCNKDSVCVCVSGVGERGEGGLPVLLWDGDWVCESGEVGWGVHTCGHRGPGKKICVWEPGAAARRCDCSHPLLPRVSREAPCPRGAQTSPGRLAPICSSVGSSAAGKALLKREGFQWKRFLLASAVLLKSNHFVGTHRKLSTGKKT